jgi:hypothetical protein
MQIVNNLIFSSTNAADGAWQDVSNMVMFSIYVKGIEAKVWVEVSNDPNVKYDGPNGQLLAPGAPVLSQFTYGSLPAQSVNVELTYTTRNQPIVTPTPLYSMAVGETLPGASASLAVLAGNTLQIASPPADAAGIATGYNVYIQNTAGVYVLQNTRGGPNASNDSSVYDGPIPLGTPFIMRMGYFDSSIPAPVTDTSGGPAVGINIQGTGGTLSSVVALTNEYPVALIGDTNADAVTVAPSSMTWKWVRVRKDSTTQGKATKAWICGGMG